MAAPQYHHEEHEAPAEYEFSYAVHDEHTGDIKSQQESRKGDVVTGHYELIDSDGFKRIVEYTADKHSGFNAVVHREPTSIKIPVPEAKHYSHPAPAHHYSAPSAPAHHHYSAPAPAVHHYTAPAPVKVTKVIKPIIVATTAAPVHHYSAPAPVHHYSAPAPVHHYSAPAPVHHYSAPAPVHHYSAPAAPVHHYSAAPSKHQEYSHEPAHVTFNAPEVNYHY